MVDTLRPVTDENLAAMVRPGAANASNLSQDSQANTPVKQEGSVEALILELLLSSRQGLHSQAGGSSSVRESQGVTCVKLT